MNLLAIDTSTENASVALQVEGKITTQEHFGAQGHAQIMLPAIECLLRQMGIDLAELDGIVFGQGPGSFTGLRVACSLAKGLAYAHDLPVYPVSTLLAIRDIALNEKGNLDSRAEGVLAIIDARMNQMYWSYATNTACDSQEESVNFAKDVFVPGTAFICLAGVGWERYEHDFPPSMIERMVERVTIYPQACAMIRLVEQGIVASVQASDAMPRYIRDKVTS